jgi:hypothetical protein
MRPARRMRSRGGVEEKERRRTAHAAKDAAAKTFGVARVLVLIVRKKFRSVLLERT